MDTGGFEPPASALRKQRSSADLLAQRGGGRSVGLKRCATTTLRQRTGNGSELLDRARTPGGYDRDGSTGPPGPASLRGRLRRGATLAGSPTPRGQGHAADRVIPQT